MRVVDTAGELTEAVAAARREAVGAFGNGTVFLERLVERPRHIEVPVFADTHGQVVHLFERECLRSSGGTRRSWRSRRRRSSTTRCGPSWGSAAIAAAKAIGYVGAGTVEFILDASASFSSSRSHPAAVEHPRH